MRVIIAAAGTGGHINPGLAIANKIKQEEPESEILFIGTPRGLEKDLVPRAGYKLETIQSYGITRSFAFENINRLFKTMKSIGEAQKIIKDFKPDIIIGTGGYICYSVCKAAQKLKVTYIIHESNVLPGVATRTLSKKAAEILLGFKEAKGKLSDEVKTTVTGTPTKIKKINLTEDEIKNKKIEIGINPDKPLVLIFGGSQGAESINESVGKIIRKRMNAGYDIIWAAGPKQYEIVKSEMMKNNINIDNIPGIKVVPYIYDMESIMNIADLLVCRSGAMTVTEIEKIGKPAIFIPYPHAAENHQEYNARILEDVGAAQVILDNEISGEILNSSMNNMTKNPEKLKTMGEKAHKLSIDNAENNIYKEIKKFVNK